MASKTKKTRKSETPEQTLSRWLAGAVKGANYKDMIDAGWEAGMNEYITTVSRDNLNYERFDLPTGGYAVVEWDADGNCVVL